MALGHRRLAILDLSVRGRQPFDNARGTTTLVYNGEAYNFHKLRTQLEQRGHQFRSATEKAQQLGVSLNTFEVRADASAMWPELVRPS